MGQRQPLVSPWHTWVLLCTLAESRVTPHPAGKEPPRSPRDSTCQRLTKAAAALTKVSSPVSVCSALAPSPGFNTFGAAPLVLLICHERSEARRGKPLQQRELKKAKLYKIKFLCSLSVVEDCHGNIFFFQRINSFSVNNVHRAAGERALFIYKIFIGDTFSLAPDSCKCFICCVLNHHKGGYYLGLRGIRRLSVLVGRVSCALFSSRKVFPESCSSSLEFRVFLQCLVLHQEQGSEALSGKQGDFGGRCWVDILHFDNGKVSPSVPELVPCRKCLRPGGWF